MASYQASIDELQELGVEVIAATVEDRNTAAETAQEDGLTIPVAYGITEEDVRELDPWWADDQHGRYVQPMELLVLRGGTIFGSMYASGPVGRMAVEQVLNSVRSRERRRLERESAGGQPAPTG